MDDEFDIIISKEHELSLKDIDKYDLIFLPIRHLLDAAISGSIRFGQNYNAHCRKNISLFNKYEPYAHYIFIYEKYDFNYIKELSIFLNLDITDEIIKDIMNELNKMLLDKSIVKVDNHSDSIYKKTLFSQSHNTSNGASNKFKTELNQNQIQQILNDQIIKEFLLKMDYSI